MTVTAYYVSPTGSDSNSGTLNAPFATFAKAQKAMQNSSVKTTYILAGNYSPNATESSPFGNAVLNLTSADSGETWSYYPADGYGSAQISGGGNITTFMSINGATGVTVNGLDIGNFTAAGIYVTNGSSNANIINNTIHDMSQYGIAVDDSGATVSNTTISNNYLYNIGSNGISVYSVHGNGDNNTTISSNLIMNAATNVIDGGNPYADAGDIYLQDLNTTASTGTEITNNYLGQSYGVALYLDDGASNATVTGNIIDPTITAFGAIQIHGGDNNVFSGNIVDVSTGLIDGYLFYQTSANPSGNRGMTGNVFEDNILVGDINSGGGNGYVGSLSPPHPLTIKNNDYWNFGSGGKLASTGSGGTGSDSNPTYKNPDFTGGSYGSSYTIASGSPVFGSPVDFPGIAGGWGPPTGTSPPPPPPPPPPPSPPSSTDLYGFDFVYNDQSYYFGWVADNGTYGYYVGETINTNNTYGGYYYIYGSAGATTDPVGSVYTKDYVDTTNGGKDYLSQSYLNGGAADGTSGLGSEFDYTNGVSGLQAFGLGGEYEAMQGTPASPPPPPPPPSTDLYEFYFVYNDQSYYFGWVADNGTYGYYVGETIAANNTYGGSYYIYGSAGATTDPVGSVYTKDYVDTTNGGKDYLSQSYLNGGAADGTSGLGSEFDYTNGANGLQAFGLGGEYEAMQGNLGPVTPTFTTPSSLTVSAGGSIALGLVISPVPSNGTISVTISGVPKFESISAADGTTPTVTKPSTTYTYDFSDLPSADWDNGLTLTSTYTGTSHPKNTFTITVSDTADGQTDTAAAQTIKVTDPPAGDTAGGTPSTQTTGGGQQTPDLALLCQYTAAGFATTPDPGAGPLVAYAAAQDASGAPNLLTIPQH